MLKNYVFELKEISVFIKSADPFHSDGCGKSTKIFAKKPNHESLCAIAAIIMMTKTMIHSNRYIDVMV